jgi:hypothetical protein
MKKSAIVLAVMLVMAFIPSTASAGKGKKGPPPPVQVTNCEDSIVDGMPQGPVDDGEFALGGHGDCNDVSGLKNGSRYTFEFEVTDSWARGVPVMLGIRNSMPGDWCDGDWWVNGVLVGTHGNLVVVAEDELKVVLEIAEDLEQPGDCGGDVMLSDGDPESHVASAWRVKDKPLDARVFFTVLN